MKTQTNVDEAKTRHAKLVDEFNLAKSEFDRGTATGATWPVHASSGLERWAERLALAGKFLMYADRNGALFDERRIAIEAARATYEAAKNVQRRGATDAKTALEHEQAVVAARSNLYHVHNRFPGIWGSSDGFPRNEIDWEEKRSGRAETMLSRAVSCLNGVARDRHRSDAQQLFGKLRAEARPTRKARLEPFRKFAEIVVQEVANDEHIRESYAVVALLEVGLYRREHERHDPDDHDRDATKKGSPMVDPPTPEELAKHFEKFFSFNEHRDAEKVKNATENQKRTKADAAKRDAENAKRWSFISQSKHQTSTTFDPALEEMKHPKVPPVLPPALPGGLLTNRKV